MTRCCLWFACCAWLLLPALAAAQAQSTQAQPPFGGGPDLKPPRMPGGSADLKKMCEDLEILRRLLNRDFLGRQMGQCASCHGRGAQSSVAFSPDGKIYSADFFAAGAGDQRVRLWDTASGRQLGTHPAVPHPFHGAEGTYLRGVGVVYTIALPIPPEAVRQPTPKPAPPPLSDWERVRRQIAGEPVEPTAVRERLVQPTLSETILKTLAENGRHFTQLAPDESLAVIVTFRGSDGVHGNTGGMGGSMAPGMGGGAGMALGLIAGGGPAGSNPKAMTTSGESLLPPLPEGARGTFGSAFNQGGPSTPLILGDGAPPSSARDYELLGDLQLKQGRIDEAVRVYKRAVELGGGSKELAGLYRKLAQAHLMRDQDTAALEAIEKALQSRRQVSAKGKSTPRTPKAAPLPAQLIVSVQKGVADHYARGAITFDQFRRAAHVELRKFTDTEK